MSENDINRRLEAIEDELRKLNTSLDGNGRPGLKTQVALLWAWKSGMSRLMWIVVGAAVTSVGGGIVTTVAALFVAGVKG